MKKKDNMNFGKVLLKDGIDKTNPNNLAKSEFNYEIGKNAYLEKIDDLSSEIEELKRLNEEQYKSLAILRSIEKHKPLYADLVEMLINKDEINIDEEGNIVGLDEQIAQIKEKYANIFLESRIKGFNIDQSDDVKEESSIATIFSSALE